MSPACHAPHIGDTRSATIHRKPEERTVNAIAELLEALSALLADYVIAW